MAKLRKIRFNVNVVRWFDRVNGNTYHSVHIQDLKTEKNYCSSPMVRGYEDAYRQTALYVMLNNKLLPKKYNEENLYLYDRENNYPIIWNVKDGLKREMINNVF